MIQYSVEFTASAKEDYENLRSYQITHPKLDISSLEVAITSLELMPERYPFFEEKLLVSNQVRILKEGDFCVFYYINKENKVVSVIRILYVQTRAVEQQLVTQ